MNARMYDPALGRMLSPDNEVQAPTSSQGFNRYSYCFNNPLKYTDPTGNNAVFYPFKDFGYFDNKGGKSTYITPNGMDINNPSGLVKVGVEPKDLCFDGGGAFVFETTYTEVQNSATLLDGAGGFTTKVSGEWMRRAPKKAANTTTGGPDKLQGGNKNTGTLQGGGRGALQPQNAQELFNILYNLGVGKTIEGGTLNKQLEGITLTRYKDGYNLKLPFFKEKLALMVGYDPNHRFTIDKIKWVDGATDIIKYTERHNGKWGIPNYIHNDGVRYFYKAKVPYYSYRFGNNYQIGNGKW